MLRRSAVFLLTLAAYALSLASGIFLTELPFFYGFAQVWGLPLLFLSFPLAEALFLTPAFAAVVWFEVFLRAKRHPSNPQALYLGGLGGLLAFGVDQLLDHAVSLDRNAAVLRTALAFAPGLAAAVGVVGLWRWRLSRFGSSCA